MGNRLDIAICGCGPAGLAAALLLRRIGHSVRVFDKFETPRPVGSGLILQPTGLGVLAEMGLADRVIALGARIDRLFGRVIPSGRVVLDVRYDALGAHWQALAIHRAALFDALHQSVLSEGIEVIPACAVSRIDRDGIRPAILTSSGSRIGVFDLIVDAMGKNSPLADGIAARTELPYGALWANVPWPGEGSFLMNALEQRYRRATHMAGLLPIGRRSLHEAPQAAFFWSLKRTEAAAWRRQNLSDWKTDVLMLWPELEHLLRHLESHEQLTFAQYDHYTAGVPYSDGVVHIGDAARATSPQLGQGANMALLDALALARALDAHSDLAIALPAYAHMRRWHIRLFQWASATFTPFYQSDSRVLPFVRDWFAAPLSRMPVGRNILSKLVSGMTVPPLAGVRFSPLRFRNGVPA